MIEIVQEDGVWTLSKATKIALLDGGIDFTQPNDYVIRGARGTLTEDKPGWWSCRPASLSVAFDPDCPLKGIRID